jgi:hypothetical protein
MGIATSGIGSVRSDSMDELVSPTRVAHILGLDPHEVYELIDRGELPAVLVDRVIRVRLADLPAEPPDRLGPGAAAR